MGYRSIQRDGFGRYYDRANEHGAHGGDYPSRDYDDLPEKPLPPRDPSTLTCYERDLLGHDAEPTPHAHDCACPTCILRAVREEM